MSETTINEEVHKNDVSYAGVCDLLDSFFGDQHQMFMAAPILEPNNVEQVSSYAYFFVENYEKLLDLIRKISINIQIQPDLNLVKILRRGALALLLTKYELQTCFCLLVALKELLCQYISGKGVASQAQGQNDDVENDDDETISPKLLLFSIYGLLGYVRRLLDDPAESVSYFHLQLSMLRDLPQSTESILLERKIKVLFQIAKAQFEKSDLAESCSTFNYILGLLLQDSNLIGSEIHVRVSCNYAWALCQFGQYTSAITQCNSCIEMCQRSNLAKTAEYEMQKAEAYRILGLCYIYKSNYARALENLRSALDLYRKDARTDDTDLDFVNCDAGMIKLGMERSLCWAKLHLAYLYVDIGRFEDAKSHLNKVIEIAKEKHFNRVYYRARNNLADLTVTMLELPLKKEKEEWQNAFNLVNNVIKETTHDIQVQHSAMETLGRLYSLVHDFTNAKQILSQISSHTVHSSQMDYVILCNEADIAIFNGQYYEAQLKLEQALKGVSSDVEMSKAKIHCRLALVHYCRKNYLIAVCEAFTACALYRNIANQLYSSNGHQTMDDSHVVAVLNLAIEAYDLAQLCLMDGSEILNDSPNQAEMHAYFVLEEIRTIKLSIEANALKTKLGQRSNEWDSLLKHNSETNVVTQLLQYYVNILERKPTPSPPQFLAKGVPDAAILVFSVIASPIIFGNPICSNKLLTWMIRCTKQVESFPIKTVEKDLWAAILSSTVQKDFLEKKDLQTLYNLFFEDAMSQIENLCKDDYVHHLIIAPDSRLNMIPWACLQSSSDTYLIDKFSISVQQSVMMCSHTKELMRNAQHIWSMWALIVGAPEGSGFSAQELSNVKQRLINHTLRIPYKMPFIDEYRGTMVSLTDTQCTKENVLRCLSSVPLVAHFDTHSIATGDKIGIVLANNDILDESDISKLQLVGTQLVVLSACRSNAGKTSSYDSMGLYRSFVKTGVPLVLGTVYKVEPSKTAEFMYRFYAYVLGYSGHVNKNLKPADALRRTMLLIKSSPNSSVKDWGGFVLYGEAQTELGWIH